jgi:hypothetical protein
MKACRRRQRNNFVAQYFRWARRVGALAIAVSAEDGAPTAAFGIVSRSTGPWWSLRGVFEQAGFHGGGTAQPPQQTG